MKRTIISSDYYNALYENGILVHEAKPDYLDSETLHTIYPDADYYGVDYRDYDELVGDRDGYPRLLSSFPLDRCLKWA